ncbi:haloacid dehalogenase-like hydrolase family protein [Neobacillus bataviensis LMG 21833]|uniref:Haloacid dehalogenase-like hydrolase family protein n=1 Tax=Neobacillus bataviensis LMG 21833 TaxID=1117379 RepID=K6CD93_9BACI|nr:HAD family hydrolase [Neobacillus bataviensis]EKN69085.1 haloacid dehalogenase-like hydrolase family protein [Neobacillus bataviensis LMG 21833]
MKAIIFDFDGLIVDTESIWYECFREVLAAKGLDLTIEQFSNVVGTTGDVLYDYIRRSLPSPVSLEEIRRSAHVLFSAKMGDPVLRDGVENYLKEANDLGLKIGLASSSSRDWVEGYLRKLQIFDCFDAIKTRDDVVEVKPHPALYLKTLEALSVSPSEAVAFEDSRNGLLAAVAAGLPCIMVPNGVTAHLDFTEAIHQIPSMAEVKLGEILKVVS